MNKKNIFKIVSIPVFIALIPASILGITKFSDPVFSDTFYGGMKIKTNRLKSAEGKKIVIIGGSNVAFSIQSGLIEGYIDDYDSVVNFGLYANLGTKLMLDLAKPYINEGDLVVIQPEQNEQSMSLYFNGEATWYVIDDDPSLKDLIPEENQSELFWSYTSFASKKFEYLINGKPQLSGIYQKSSFDEYGDIIYQRDGNEMFGAYDSGTPIAFSDELLDDDFIEYLNDFSSEMASRGADTVFSFCPMNSYAVTNENNFNEYLLMLKNKLNFPIAGLNDDMIVNGVIDSTCKVKEAIMEPNWFYDSNFHTNTIGSTYFSYQLVNRLCEYLGVNKVLSYTEIEKEKPEIDEITDSGNYQTYGELKYTEVDIKKGQTIKHGISIKGLVKDSTLKNVVIPDYIDSLPVLQIDVGAFKNNTNIERISIPSTIISLGNRAFIGMTNLTAFIVNFTIPTQAPLAGGQFPDSSNLKIYVPDEALTAFENDYYWGTEEYEPLLKKISQLPN